MEADGVGLGVNGFAVRGLVSQTATPRLKMRICRRKNCTKPFVLIPRNFYPKLFS